MASSPRRHRRPRLSGFRSRARQFFSASDKTPVGLLVLTGLLYAAIGTMVSTFPVPGWVWGLVLSSAISHSVAIASPRALRRFRWWSANVLALLAILGAGATVVALAIALSYAGTDSIDEITPKMMMLETFGVSVLAIAVAALSAIAHATLSDRLLRVCTRWQATLLAAAASLASLGVGALIGSFLIAP